MAWGILVPQPGIEPRPSAVKPRSPNHWTAREFPKDKVAYKALYHLNPTLSPTFHSIPATLVSLFFFKQATQFLDQDFTPAILSVWTTLPTEVYIGYLPPLGQWKLSWSYPLFITLLISLNLLCFFHCTYHHLIHCIIYFLLFIFYPPPLKYNCMRTMIFVIFHHWYILRV